MNHTHSELLPLPELMERIEAGVEKLEAVAERLERMAQEDEEENGDSER